MDKIEETQLGNIQKAAEMMADTIEAGRWVHTFGCGHGIYCKAPVSRQDQSAFRLLCGDRHYRC